MIISIDFDGTIVRERWPDIGSPLPGALAAIRKLHAAGHTIIINSCRAGAAEKYQQMCISMIRASFAMGYTGLRSCIRSVSSADNMQLTGKK